MQFIQHHKSQNQWTYHQNVWCRGLVFWKGKGLTQLELAQVVHEECIHIDALQEWLQNVSGTFALVIQWGTCMVLVSDHGLSYPLFYDKEAKEILDHMPAYKGEGIECQDYKSLGWMPLNTTFLPQVWAIQSRQIACISSDEFEVIDYLPHYEKVNDFKHEIELWWKERAEFFKDKECLVPLSGGYDSRYILLSLKQAGIKNITAYSFGVYPNEEAIISEEVAKRLGVRWLFFDQQKCLHEVFEEEEFKEYIRFAGRGRSTPYIQDFYALKYFIKKGLVSNEAYVLPGYAGDFVGGSQLLKKYLPFKLNLAHHYLHLFKDPSWKEGELSSATIRAFDERYEGVPKETFTKATFWEGLDEKERISKEVMNASSVYDYLGFNKFFFLWEDAFQKLFIQSHWSQRLMNKELNHYFETEFHYADIDFRKLKPSFWGYFKQMLKYKIGKVSPYQPQSDVYYYPEILHFMEKQMKSSHLKEIMYKSSRFNRCLQFYYLDLFLQDENPIKQ